MERLWKIDTGQIYSPVQGAFVTDADPGSVDVLYSDTSDAAHLIIADAHFLRTEILAGIARGNPWILADELKNRMDTIQDIQAAYAPRLTALQEAKSGAEMRDDAEAVAEIKAEYVALLQEMNDKIQAVPHD